MRLPVVLPFALLLHLSAGACTTAPPETTSSAVVVQTPAAGFTEGFEQGQKSSYAEATEELPTGAWQLVEGLIGSSAQDHKRGERAVRLRGSGRLRMNFDAPAGISRIQISSAAYGQDGPSTWELWGSQDGGRTYRRIGQPVRTQGPRLTLTTFTGGSGQPLRLEIRKTDGSDARLNLDDIALLPGTGTPRPATQPVATRPAAPASPAPGARPALTRDDNLALGNPSGATASLTSPTNYLLTRPQYALSYNARRGTPNWVCWHLSPAWLGDAPRQDDFRPDPALPRQFYAVTPRSYSGSGFDRGHNCPSADRTTDLDDNSATFLMTNMIPQAGPNNQRTWSGLEEWTRHQVQLGQEVYVLMGSYGVGGTGTQGFKTTLDAGRLTVPARVWKVLVILPQGDDDLRRIAAGQARVVAVDTPNDMQVNPDWSRYRVSVDALEAATGLDLLSALPLAVQAQLESRVDAGPTR